MPTLLHTLTDSVMKRVRRSPFYYERYNNTCDFATNRSYAQYAQECRAIYEKEHGAIDLAPSPLWENAATSVPKAFSEQKARAYSEKISELIKNNDPYVEFSKKDNLCIHIQQPLTALGTDLVDVLRAPEVHKNLLAFFRSHYRIEWVTCYRSLATTNRAGSWLWHSDSFPPHTCKMFLHLTRTTAETGAMEMMNREDTMAYRRAGYFGQFQDERLADLQDFAKAHGLPYRPFRFDTDPGDATLFDMNFFHRAVAPHTGIRDVVCFLFFPNLVSWEEQLKLDGGVERRGMRAPGKLPKNPSITEITTSGTLAMM